MAKVEPPNDRSAGAARENRTDKNETVFQFSWWLKKQGYSDSTAICRSKLLKVLTKRGVNLHNPESVKDAIARQNWSNGRKENAVHAYTSFLKMVGGTWNPPKYKRVQKLPWVPNEFEVDQLIAGCSIRVATFLQLLKETGMRPGEAWALEWIDIDLSQRSVRITPEKGSNPRVLKLSSKLVAMLNTLHRREKYVFRNGLLKHFTGNFRQQRKRQATKLGNPRINMIAFKTLRHFMATMEYHKTKDILHVKHVLGHKSINSTLVYTHLLDFKDDEYVSRVARNADEASQLVEAGFEYVCTAPENLLVFRKRK